MDTNGGPPETLPEVQEPLLGPPAPKEDWRPISGYPEHQVNSEGVVRRITVLVPYKDYEGYAAVRLYYNGRHSSKRLHRLVADGFLPNPDRLPQTDHLDGDRMNPHLANLQRVTGLENQRRSWLSGKRLETVSRGEKHRLSKVTDEQVREIRHLANTVHQHELAARFGITQHAVHCIVHRKTWKHIPAEPTDAASVIQLKGAEHNMAKLSSKQVEEIRASVGVRQEDLALRYGVSRPLISLILNRKIWT